jgi:hypothetical protein
MPEPFTSPEMGRYRRYLATDIACFSEVLSARHTIAASSVGRNLEGERRGGCQGASGIP